MTLDEIKNLIEADKGKFIIVENGKPLLVVMSFDDYKKILEKENVHSETEKNQNPNTLEPIVEEAPTQERVYPQETLDDLPV